MSFVLFSISLAILALISILYLLQVLLRLSARPQLDRLLILKAFLLIFSKRVFVFISFIFNFRLIFFLLVFD